MIIFRFSSSLGSVPTLHIASQKAYSNLGGIILLSPLGAGVKVVNLKNINNFDDLAKVKMIDGYNLQDISCSVFIIHGMKDTVIPQISSEEMSKKLSKASCWFPENGDHTNILIDYRFKFYSKCMFFLSNLLYNFSEEESTSMNFNIKHMSMKYVENYIKHVNSNDDLKQYFSEDELNDIVSPFKTSIPIKTSYDSIRTKIKQIKPKLISKSSNKEIQGFEKVSTSHDDRDDDRGMLDQAFHKRNSFDSDYETEYIDQEKQYDLIKNNSKSAKL